MTSALFTYRRRVVINNVEVYNDNYLNPLNVQSFYWQQSDEGNRSLCVFLGNQYSITFAESVGKRFVEHMEDFLRYVIGVGIAKPATPTESKVRHARKPITAEIVEDIDDSPSAEWQTAGQ
jgi:hypothetical protein